MNEPRTETGRPSTDAAKLLLHDFDDAKGHYNVNGNTESDYDRILRGILAIEAVPAPSRDALAEALAQRVGAAARQWAEHILAALPVPAAAPLDVETP